MVHRLLQLKHLLLQGAMGGGGALTSQVGVWTCSESRRSSEYRAPLQKKGGRDMLAVREQIDADDDRELARSDHADHHSKNRGVGCSNGVLGCGCWFEADAVCFLEEPLE